MKEKKIELLIRYHVKMQEDAWLIDDSVADELRIVSTHASSIFGSFEILYKLPIENPYQYNVYQTNGLHNNDGFIEDFKMYFEQAILSKNFVRTQKGYNIITLKPYVQ